MSIYLLFYPKGVKTIPLDIAKYLILRALAFWVMDDGSWAGNGLLLHTNSFKVSEVDLLIVALHEKFGFNPKKRNKYSKWIIYISLQKTLIYYALRYYSICINLFIIKKESKNSKCRYEVRH
jgi:hypothetical protein